MSRQEEYAKVERERIVEQIEKITDLRHLSFIFKLAMNLADDSTPKTKGV